MYWVLGKKYVSISSIIEIHLLSKFKYNQYMVSINKKYFKNITYVQKTYKRYEFLVGQLTGWR